MKTGIRLIVEYYNVKTGEILSSEVIRDDVIKKPNTIKGLGYLHEEQISLLQSIQDIKLRYEIRLLNQEETCPKCGKKSKSNGMRKSKFHAVFTDHDVNIQRRHCQCGWNSSDTIEQLYGSSSHPDLIEKQVIQGVENSYRQASRQLNAESKKIRGINNDDRIRRNVATVAKIIEEEKLKPGKVVNQNKATKQLVTVIDGGHLKSNDNNADSFEAMLATVFCPDNLRRIDKHHNEILKKTSVASALSNHQKTIKQLVLNACHKEGMNAKVTELTCLTDGASNCWSISVALKRYCKKLINVLDWFHITKRFTVINNRVDTDFKEKLEKVKWFLWHGKAKEGLKRLAELQGIIENDKLLSDLQDLYEYLNRNKKYMVNYQKRQAMSLPFTSTYAESSVNTLINTRQKDNKKMQWSREGAHSILQIRTSRFSKTWSQDWKKAQYHIYKNAA
jgi:hypothetical protein